MRWGIFVLLIINGLLFQACTSVQVETIVKMKRAKTIQAEDSPNIPIDKDPMDFNSIRDEDPCRLDPSDSSCPQQRRETAACPAAQILASKIAQDTGVWCWAASAQSIMEAYGAEKKQCEIINEVENLSEDCCSSGNATNPLCLENGWPHEAFEKSDFGFEFVQGPLPKSKVASQLCDFGPFIFVIRLHGGGGHSFVVKELELVDGELFLWVHDHSWFVNEQGVRGPSEFKKWSYDAFVEGLWLGMNSTNSDHFIDYIQVQPN